VAEGRPTISTHVLDTQRGEPARGVTVVLTVFGPPGPRTLSRLQTDDDGRIRDLLDGGRLEPAMYELTFQVGSYQRSQGGEGRFFRQLSVLVEVSDPARSYHVPLLLSAFGMTTYRGS
jgi:5-hydroxyisourate hydrolase